MSYLRMSLSSSVKLHLTYLISKQVFLLLTAVFSWGVIVSVSPAAQQDAALPATIEWNGRTYARKISFDFRNLKDSSISDSVSDVKATVQGTFLSDAEGLHCDGKSTAVSIEDRASVKDILSGSFIMLLRIKPVAYEPTYNSYLFTQRGIKPDAGLTFGIGGIKNRPGRLSVTEGAKGVIVGRNEEPVELNKWASLKFCYDREKRRMELFMDERLLGRRDSLENINLVENPIYLAGWPARKTYYFTGILQEFILYGVTSTAPVEKSVPAAKIPEMSDVSGEDWMINRRGIEALDDNFVLPPFTPVSVSENGTANVWGRKYTFDEYGLVRQVDIQSQPFFEKPMDFEIVVSGRNIEFRPEGIHLLRNPRGKAEFFSRAGSTEMDIEVRTTVEYDGMVRVDFTMLPRGTVALNRFQYRIHFPEKRAVFLRYDGARTSYESGNIPRNSYSRSTPEGMGTVWKSPFKTLVWLGDFDRGYLWFCASESNWTPQERKDRPDALSIIRSGSDVILQVKPVSEIRMISKPVTFTFGMFATPVRPLPEGWRGWTQAYSTADEKWTFPYSTGTAKFLYHPQGLWAVAPFYPRIKDFEGYRRMVAEKQKEGKYLMPYIDARIMSLGILRDPGVKMHSGWEIPDFELDENTSPEKSQFSWKPMEIRYYKEWRVEPPVTMRYGAEQGHRQFEVSSVSSYADFFCYLIEQQAKAGVRGIANLDEWNPTPVKNPSYGMGYADQRGVWQPEYDTFAKRDIMKRICAIFLKETGKPPIVVAHMASTLCMPFISHFSAILTGEHFNTGYFARPELLGEYFQNAEGLYESLKQGGKNWYYYAAPLDRWQTECIGKKFGFPIMVMGQLTKGSIKKEIAESLQASRELLALTAVHDNLTWPTFVDPKPFYLFWKIREDFGIADAGVEFYPYWEKKRPAITEQKDIYVSSYYNRGRWLINASNLGLNNVSSGIRLIPQSVSKRGIKNIKDAETGKTVPLSGNLLKLDIPARDVRILIAE
jgi:hypothetical protein